MSEKKSESQNRGKPNVTLDAKGNQKFQQKAVGGSGTNGDGISASLICFKCGELGYHVDEGKSTGHTCFKCEKKGHCAADCKSAVFICFNCRESCHINIQSQKSRKAPEAAWASWKVFALSGEETSRPNN